MVVSLKDYASLMDDRPKKMTPKEVGYREANDLRRCGKCLHFYERKIDGYGVCELMRLEDEEPVEASHTCDLFTVDGEKFPLYPGSR
jgi:hypothetical protein